MKLKNVALAVAALTVSSAALAHGYIESPPGRAMMCKTGENTGCGNVQWEPQSVEQVSGFPSRNSPPDGELAGAGKYSELDQQSSGRWAKTPVKAGKNIFTWHHTAPHKTANWRYYITRQNWDPNQPLTRDAFELTPFCEIDGKGVAPQPREAHECVVPERTGYQVIYGVWEIADTVNSFYQAIDVDFGNGDNHGGGDIVQEWSKTLKGQITGKPLKAGDTVLVRFFDLQGEVTSLQTALKIGTDEQGDSNSWAYALADLVNRTHGEVRVGQMDSEGTVSPVYGINNVYTRAGSQLESVEISYEEQAQQAKESISVSDVKASKISDGQSQVEFNVEAKGTVRFEGRIMDHMGHEKGYVNRTVTDDSLSMTMTLNDVMPGHYMLKYFATNADGKLIKQDVVDLQLESAGNGGSGSEGKYDFVFPDGLKSYKAGTVVLQPEDGMTYECKPFPYSGYCIQWTQGARQFEPGVGSNWKDAWVMKH